MANRADVLAHVSHNLRHFRQESGLSQAALADASGISRRMIVKVEGGDTNISLASLDRLAEALDVTFVDMVRDPDTLGDGPTDLNVLAWRGDHEASVGRLLASVPASQESQLWAWTLGPGDRYDAEPDPPGWWEIIVVATGRLRIEFDSSATELGPGESISFPSSQPYRYLNAADELTRFARSVVR
ncbi:XRE family transcriptional regulator [Gordonia sp. i37]|uniref:helix-turn-helix domain-containing protein n=1 Tax=Gordonia sp. i37 TaxID=1961707 RepID=UPI0009AEBC8D|nr:XRE family transcriptional regulator [Gordonia sp. i37]OPX16094.1 Cro/Cl family transcriptional regulator [Gordonia sp. i37]